MKIITSTIKTLPGTVGLYDPIPMDRIYLIEELLFDRNKKDVPPAKRAELHAEFFKAVFSCVEEWKLEGLTGAVTFDDLRAGAQLKRKVLGELEGWITTEVMALYYGDTSDPNA